MTSPCDRVYRPRRPWTSALWQLLDRFLERFLEVYEERFAQKYGPLRPWVAPRIRAYLRCGLLDWGFLRVVCDSCRRELLVAFSCRAKGLCPSCAAKRRAVFTEFLNDHVLEDVPHRHIVLGLPIVLRGIFLRDRRLLTDLSRCAWKTLLEVLQEATGSQGVPAAVVSIHTAGALLDFHVHIQEPVIHRILKHLDLLGLAEGPRERAPPEPIDVVVEMLDHDPFPHYETVN